MGRDVKTYAHQFRTAYRRRHGRTRYTRYTRLSQCSNRYPRVNNKYMLSYDPSKSSSYLMYFDVNNLYGWVMCQPLSYADFRWVDNISNFMDTRPQQVTFSRWTIRNIFTHTLTYRSARRAINQPASGKTNSSQLYTIRSVMSYIIQPTAVYSSWPPYHKDSPRIVTLAISMTSQLYRTQYEF